MRQTRCITDLLFLGLWILFVQPALATVTMEDKPPQAEIREVILQPEDTLHKVREHYAARFLSDFHQKGYLNAKIDSISSESLLLRFFISTGQPFQYIINQSNISPQVTAKLRIEKYLLGNTISFTEFEQLTITLLKHYENSGYPFARLSKKEISISENIIQINLQLDPHELIVYDTLQIGRDVSLSKRFLEHHTGISPGNPYSELQVQGVADKIRELDFVTLESAPTLSFSPGKASLQLPLKKSRANRFDGIAGLASNEGTEGQFRLTGLLSLYLSNTLGEGEFLDLTWQAPGQGSQLLNITAAYPYLLGLPLRSELLFALQRRDTTWMQVQFKPALFAQTASGLQWGVFVHYTKGSLISTKQYTHTTTKPQNLDFVTRLYGIEFRHKTSAYQQNLLMPGYRIVFSTAAGNRIISINSNLPAQIYDDIPLKRLQINGQGNLEKRWKTSGISTFTLENSFAWLNGRNLPENQLYRLGGFRSLKGFDELSMAASAYFVSTAELRFFAGQSTFFSILVNGGWYERHLPGDYYNDFPVGFGAGMNIETQAGIFALYFAMGTQKNIPLEFRNTKIHLGYVSTF